MEKGWTNRRKTTWTKNITDQVSGKVEGPLLEAKNLLEKMGIYYPDSSYRSKYEQIYVFLNNLGLPPFVITDALKNPYFLSFGIQIASSLVLYILEAFFKAGVNEVKRASEGKGLHKYPKAMQILMEFFVPELDDEMDFEIKKAMMELFISLERSNHMKMSFILYKITKKYHSTSSKISEEDIIRYVEKAGLVIMLIYYLYVVNYIIDAPVEVKKRASFLISSHGESSNIDKYQLEKHVNSVLEKKDLDYINWAVYHFLSAHLKDGESFSLLKKLLIELMKECLKDKTTKKEVKETTEKRPTYREMHMDETVFNDIFAPLEETLNHSGLSLLLIDALISKILINSGLKYEMGIKGDSFDEGISHIMRKLRTSLQDLDFDKKVKIKQDIVNALENPLEFWKH